MPMYSMGYATRDGGLGNVHMKYTPAPGAYNPTAVGL